MYMTAKTPILPSFSQQKDNEQTLMSNRMMMMNRSRRNRVDGLVVFVCACARNNDDGIERHSQTVGE